MITELLNKYFWLIQTLTRAGNTGMLLEDIQDRWERRWGESYPRRSFSNHRQAIEECFGITIACRRNDNRYYIEQEAGNLEQNGSFRWIMDSMAVNSLTEMRKDALKGRIAIEDVPQGHTSLISLAGAMQDNVKVRISYQKYSSKASSSYTIRPYALKENSRRWYLIGYCEERKGIRVYALDRIKSVEPSLNVFNMPADFDVDELFAGCFGVYLPDEGMKRSRIVFRTTEEEARYIKDLPIHNSQKQISVGGGFVTFEIYVYMNRDLMMEFLSRGNALEILEPADLRQSIKQELTKARNLYE